jgi:hypothetical protein
MHNGMQSADIHCGVVLFPGVIMLFSASLFILFTFFLRIMGSFS